MKTPEERAVEFRKFCYDRMIDDTDAEFLVVLAATIREAVREKSQECEDLRSLVESKEKLVKFYRDQNDNLMLSLAKRVPPLDG